MNLNRYTFDQYNYHVPKPPFYPPPTHSAIIIISCFLSHSSFRVSVHPPLFCPALRSLSPLPCGQTWWPRLPVSFDVSDVTPALQMPLRRQSYPSREPAERKPVINPAQPGPPLHCLNTWCITVPTPSLPPPAGFTQTCMCGWGPVMQRAL